MNRIEEERQNMELYLTTCTMCVDNKLWINVKNGHLASYLVAKKYPIYATQHRCDWQEECLCMVPISEALFINENYTWRDFDIYRPVDVNEVFADVVLQSL